MARNRHFEIVNELEDLEDLQDHEECAEKLHKIISRLMREMIDEEIKKEIAEIPKPDLSFMEKI